MGKKEINIFFFLVDVAKQGNISTMSGKTFIMFKIFITISLIKQDIQK